MNDIGRTLLSGLAQTICYVHGLNRREITLSQIGFFAELRDKHDVDDASFLVDGAAPLQRAVANTVSISDTNDMEIGTAPNISIARQKNRTIRFSNRFSNAETATANEWLRSFAFARNQRI